MKEQERRGLRRGFMGQLIAGLAPFRADAARVAGDAFRYADAAVRELEIREALEEENIKRQEAEAAAAAAPPVAPAPNIEVKP